MAADTSSGTGTQVLAPGPERLCSRPVFVYARLCAHACLNTDATECAPRQPDLDPRSEKVRVQATPPLIFFQVRVNDSESFVEHCGVFSCRRNLNRRA